ncbi:hypothetical protein H4582DRAFT_2055115 [Lactarius indigo]|nr:hypothetical protein H4582DRAFT_2055115 [Lactarius indigo]
MTVMPNHCPWASPVLSLQVQCFTLPGTLSQALVTPSEVFPAASARVQRIGSTFSNNTISGFQDLFMVTNPSSIAIDKSHTSHTPVEVGDYIKLHILSRISDTCSTTITPLMQQFSAFSSNTILVHFLSTLHSFTRSRTHTQRQAITWVNPIKAQGMELPAPAGAGGARSSHWSYEAADYSAYRYGYEAGIVGPVVQTPRFLPRVPSSHWSNVPMQLLRASAALRKRYVQGPRRSMGNSSVEEGARRWCRDEVDDTM